MNCVSAPQEVLKGRLTYIDAYPTAFPAYGYGNYAGYDDAMPQSDAQTNRWSSTENSSNNSWNSNFNSGNINNNNKYNRFRVRPVVAYDTPIDFLNLVLEAFYDCCRRKRTSQACIDYMQIANEDLPALAHELYTGTYQPGLSTCFLVKYPKYREVFAACFRDRIVHHFLFIILNPYFEERFTKQGNVSFNCRKGFGTLAAQRAVAKAMREATDGYRRKAWIYRGDIVSFFMSIDKRILWRKLEPFINTNYNGPYLAQVIAVARVTVFHCPEHNCVFNTDPAEWKDHIETLKSLFGNTDHFGMPIGNLTTQLFVNFFMSFFDEFVIAWFSTRGYRVYYVRFVDDFIVICVSRTVLKVFVKSARVFMYAELGIELHTDKYHFQPASHGVMFVGAYIKFGRIYLSNRTIARFTERVYGFNELLNNKEQVTLTDLCRIEQVVNSYLGFCRDKRTYSIRRAILFTFCRAFYEYFYIKGHYDGIRLRTAHKPIKTTAS